MQKTLAVFRSRTEAFIFSNLLSSYGVSSSIINTPRRISVSCGISVVFDTVCLSCARGIMSRRKFDSFVGFFS